MGKATENDTDLMMEVQSFWIEPALHIPLLGGNDISSIALGVLWWLQVCPVFLSPASLFKLVPTSHQLVF